MKMNSVKRNLYFYRWDREYIRAAESYDRVTCSIRDFDYDDNLEDFSRLRSMGLSVCAYLPVLWKDKGELEPEELGNLADAVYVGNAGQIEWAKKTGKPVLGDAGLNIFNAESVKFYAEKGLKGMTLSYELDSDAEQIIKALSDSENSELQELELEILRSGRVQAMVSEYCPLAGASGIKGDHCGSCMQHNPVYLKDYKGERYPVVLDDTDCTALILSKNSLNRKNSAKSLANCKNSMERVTVFDESPSFLAKI